MKAIPSYIALFRVIHVGGKHTLPMKALAGIVEAHGYSSVKTYIQSGNMVFGTTWKVKCAL